MEAGGINSLINSLLPDHSTLHTHCVQLRGSHSGGMFAQEAYKSDSGDILTSGTQIWGLQEETFK